MKNGRAQLKLDMIEILKQNWKIQLPDQILIHSRLVVPPYKAQLYKHNQLRDLKVLIVDYEDPVDPVDYTLL